MKTLLPNVRCQTIQPDVYFWFPGSNKTPVNSSKVSSIILFSQLYKINLRILLFDIIA